MTDIVSRPSGDLHFPIEDFKNETHHESRNRFAISKFIIYSYQIYRYLLSVIVSIRDWPLLFTDVMNSRELSRRFV